MSKKYFSQQWDLINGKYRDFKVNNKNFPIIGPTKYFK